MKDTSFIINNDKKIPNYYIFYLLRENRDKIYDLLLKENIEPGKHFHKCIDWAKEFGYDSGDCPIAEKISKEIITIPTHLRLSSSKLSKIKQIFLSTLVDK